MKLRKNKKGFSLVELMIVVVIMGILIAVAIPLYNGIVEKSRQNVCQSNQRTVRSCFAEWILMDGSNNASTLFKTAEKVFDASKGQKPEDVFPPEFLNFFEDGVFPECPEENHYYRITYLNNSEIKVECIADGTVDDGHTPDEEK